MHQKEVAGSRGNLSLELLAAALAVCLFAEAGNVDVVGDPARIIVTCTTRQAAARSFSAGEFAHEPPVIFQAVESPIRQHD